MTTTTTTTLTSTPNPTTTTTTTTPPPAPNMTVPTTHNPSVTTLLSAIESRHTYVDLDSTSPIPDSDIITLSEHIMRHVPTAFNQQHVRLVLLLGSQHDRYWALAEQAVRATFPESALAITLPKIAKYRAAHGTATFWNEPAPMDRLAAANKVVAPLLPDWTEHAQGMHQFALWTVLEAAGLGANLQHYSWAADVVKEAFGIPAEWKSSAQLVFGGIAGEKRPRGYETVEGWRMFVRDGGAESDGLGQGVESVQAEAARVGSGVEVKA